MPGHTDIPGNELADSLAKEATTLPPDPYELSSNETSFVVLGLRIKQARLAEWYDILRKSDLRPSSNPASYSRKYSWKTHSKIQLPPRTRRELASAFYQLKLGHGYFKSYLYRLGHTTSDRCKCGQKETPEHLLLSCTEHKVAREKLKSEMHENRLSLPMLLHTKLGIEKTLGFLKETRMATRRWHLERGEEEEEVEV